MTGQPAPARDYWAVRSTPAPTTTADDVRAHLDAHLAWLAGLEQTAAVFLSGPRVEGPDAAAGAGLTILRASSAREAEAIAATDPLVEAGLRTVRVRRWRINEGSVALRVTLSTGTGALG